MADTLPIKQAITQTGAKEAVPGTLAPYTVLEVPPEFTYPKPMSTSVNTLSKPYKPIVLDLRFSPFAQIVEVDNPKEGEPPFMWAVLLPDEGTQFNVIVFPAENITRAGLTLRAFYLGKNGIEMINLFAPTTVTLPLRFLPTQSVMIKAKALIFVLTGMPDFSKTSQVSPTFEILIMGYLGPEEFEASLPEPETETFNIKGGVSIGT